MPVLPIAQQKKPEFIKAAKDSITFATSKLIAVKMDIDAEDEGDEWKVGATVKHSIFGSGTIVGIKDDMISVKFFNIAMRTIKKDKVILC